MIREFIFLAMMMTGMWLVLISMRQIDWRKLVAGLALIISSFFILEILAGIVMMCFILALVIYGYFHESEEVLI